MLTGCISQRSYVDPLYGDVKQGDLKKVETPHKIYVETEFLRNGMPFGAADRVLRQAVDKAFVESKVVLPQSEPDQVMIKVSCNNIADIGGSVGKGIGTGLTFGLAGSSVTDYYEIEIEWVENGKAVNKNYEHAIHTTIGAAKAPVEWAEPIPLADAFNRVIKDVIFQFIQDMQIENRLSRVDTLLEAAA